jgi:hypothetical protein
MDGGVQKRVRFGFRASEGVAGTAERLSLHFVRVGEWIEPLGGHPASVNEEHVTVDKAGCV